MQKMRNAIITLAILASCMPISAGAATLLQEKVTVFRGVVESVLLSDNKQVEGAGVSAVLQTLSVRIASGEYTGGAVEVLNDLFVAKKGDAVFVRHTIHEDGRESYIVSDSDRLFPMGLLCILFLIATCLIGGRQGLRGLASLVGSLLFIFGILLPGLLSGYSPILLAMAISSVIIIFGSYITHGINRTTTSAVIGMILTIIITGVLALLFSHTMHLSGFGSEESTYLNLNTRGTLDIAGIFLGGVMIGLLGVLYDAAISQAIAVEELIRIAPHLSRKIVYERGLRIGREHIGALVNTLAIAYVGASLPLLLIFYQSQAPFFETVNREVFAGEVLRTVVGSLGLILAVPITTTVTLFLWRGKVPPDIHQGHSHIH